MSQVYVALGDREAALRSLEQAVRDHAPWIGWMRGEPALEPLVSDPRYQALLQKLGLPPRPARRASATSPS